MGQFCVCGGTCCLISGNDGRGKASRGATDGEKGLLKKELRTMVLTG